MKPHRNRQPLATLVALAILALLGTVSAQVPVTTLYCFRQGTDGGIPRAGLVLGTDGAFYGTTSQGGDTNLQNGWGRGTVFRITPAGALTTLATIEETNGMHAMAELIQSADGALYGTCDSQFGIAGSVFRIATNGGLTTLAWFNATNGSGSRAPVVQGPDGFLYGVGEGAGAEPGSVFRVGTNGGLNLLFQFSYEQFTSGVVPYAGLTFGPDGDLYGMTGYGGTNTTERFPKGMGILYKISTNGAFTKLIDFAGSNGALPMSGLTLGSDGNFYGTTTWGGVTNAGWPDGMGTAFRLKRDNTLETLFQFNLSGGASPAGRLLEGADGAFYGTASEGGDRSEVGSGAGTVFKLTTNGVLTTLHEFGLLATGATPLGGLIRGADGNFYGTTANGGIGGEGTIFKMQMVPAFSSEPVAVTGMSDDLVSFAASAGGAGSPPAFTWLKDGVPIVDSEHRYAVTIGTNSTLYIVNADWRDAGIYSVLARNVFGTTTSSNAALALQETFPAITSQPVARTNELTSAAIFTVAATGHPAPAYQWFKDGAPLANDARISGAASNRLVIANLTAADAGNYSVRVTNHAGATDSLVAALRMLPTVWQIPLALNATDYIWITGGDADWVPDSNLDGAYPGTISDSQESWLETTIQGPAVLSFWWWVDSERNGDYLTAYLDGSRWARISGSADQQETITIAPGTHTVRWSYSKNASGAERSDTGGLYQLTITPFEPRIRAQPQSHTNFAGTPVRFAVTVTGVPTPACQWRKDGADLPGETRPTLSLPSVALQDAGGYSVLVSNDSGSLTSAVAQLTVLPAITLADALNIPLLPLASGGNAAWLPVAEPSHDRFAAGQSGLITDSQTTWMETTVTGPGTLYFWWKVSSETDCDYLTLLTNGVLVEAISGEVSWTQQTVLLGPGSHTLRWEYGKDGSVSVGQDAAWVDQVGFISARPVPILLTAQRAGGLLALSWDNPAFQLQSATDITGPFTAVPGATSPYTNTTTGARLFFRLQSP